MKGGPLMKRALYVPLILAFTVSVPITVAAKEKDKGNSLLSKLGFERRG